MPRLQDKLALFTADKLGSSMVAGVQRVDEFCLYTGDKLPTPLGFGALSPVCQVKQADPETV